jgi:hypothetical protein
LSKREKERLNRGKGASGDPHRRDKSIERA